MKGDRVECIINFLSDNEFISNFVLASSDSGTDTLISAFTGKQRSKIKVPLTIIPSKLTEEEIDKLFWINYVLSMFIQTEETPNPQTLKFLPGKILLKNGTLEFKNKEEAKENHLANNLFEDKNVSSVFIGNDFITITKSSNVDWEVVKPVILSKIHDFFSSGNEIEENKNNNQNLNNNYTDKDQEIVNQIIDLLDQRIKPAVAQDGGDISFVKFENGVVFLELRGACSGCPSSTITLKSGIENMLKYYIPEITSVEAINPS